MSDREPPRPIVLEAGGARLEAQWIGVPRPGRPTLVFLHDGLGCVATWRDFPAALAGAVGCPALAYSRAGYGGSSPAAGPRPVRFMHDEALLTLPAVLRSQGIDDAILVGHSDGASISLIYAASSPAIRVRGLVLEAPHVFVEPVCLESIAELRSLSREAGLLDRLARYHGQGARRCFESWAEVWLRPEFAAWNITGLLHQVACPVLVIQGEQDEFGTLAQVHAITTHTPGPTSALVLPHCGHTPHHQQREATLEEMTAFVARLLG